MSPRLSLCLIGLSVASPALAVEPPDGIRQMIWTALDTKDPTVIAAVIGVAKQTAPWSAAEIDIIAQRETERVVQEAMPRPQRTPPPEPASELSRIELPPLTPPSWKGSVEVGAARSPGNTETIALYGAADLALQQGDWTHKVRGRADYQESRGSPTAERFAIAYQPQLQINDGIYAYGLGQFEHDRFQGYRERYTLGAGVGVTAVSRPNLTVAVDAGPALRHTRFYVEDDQDALAARASLTMKWLPLPNVTIGQDMAFYVENHRTTARSATAIDTLLFGPLKARLSYIVELEKERPTKSSDVDTTTRASLVYSF